jgi:hypothetical protein
MSDRGTALSSKSVSGGGKTDVIAAAAVGAIGCLVFSSTFSPHVALGDAPESVSGVKTLGVLHAPGYPTYVLLSRAFADVVAVGSWASRVNRFSLVCATLTVAVVFLLARSFGASIPGAAVGALALACSTSFWFNASFAKHYALSGLLVSLSALLVVSWQQRRHTILLVLAAGLLGACIGAAWQLAAIMAIGLVVLLALGPEKPRRAAYLSAAAAMLGVAAASLAFMVVRARQNPPINWGDVSSAHRLVSQTTQQDFRGARDVTSHGGNIIGRLGVRTISYIGIIVRDLGPLAAILAVAGLVAACHGYGRLPRDKRVFLVVVLLLNLATIIVVPTIEPVNGLDLDHIAGFFTGVALGGYLLDASVVIAILIALGTTRASEEVNRWVALRRAPARSRSRARSRARTIQNASGRIGTGVAVGIAVLTVVPSLFVHYSYANHRIPALADHYGHRVLAGLPHNAALIVGGYEFGQPIIYRQLVVGERTDVTVVSDDLLVDDWYRELLARQLDPGSRHSRIPSYDDTVARIRALRAERPVFVDTSAMALDKDRYGYRAHGLVGEVVDGTGAHTDTAGALDTASRALLKADTSDRLARGKYSRFPNQWLYYFHQRAHVELAKQYFMNGNVKAVATELHRALALASRPDEPNTLYALELLRRNDPRAGDVIKNL